VWKLPVFTRQYIVDYYEYKGLLKRNLAQTSHRRRD
jgi:hypothetical protein